MVMTVFQRWPYAGRSASELGMPKTPMNCQATTTVMEVLALWILAHGSAQRWLITCTEGLARGPQGLSPSHEWLKAWWRNSLIEQQFGHFKKQKQ
jgi:hypothetical protein